MPTQPTSLARHLLALALLPSLATPMTAEKPKSASGSPDLAAWLETAEVTCHTMKTWGELEKGDDRLIFDISCLLPELPGGVDPQSIGPSWLSSQTDPDRRYVAAATLFALDQRLELAAEDRAAFVMELARREKEPFASATIGFGFGETAWWDLRDQEDLERREFRKLVPVGYLTAPLKPSTVAVIRSYLFRELENETDGRSETRVSTLAVYTLSLMIPMLDQSIVPDLERILELQPESFEAELAESILAELKTE